MHEKITIESLQNCKGKRKIAALTAYDYSLARLVDAGGVDMVLIGDTLGMVILGDDSTKQVTMDDMLRHTKAVAKAVERALIVADMPINSFSTLAVALKNAEALVAAGAGAVKIEGEAPVVPVIEHLVAHGIAVMGHVGLTPQSADSFKVQGKNKQDATRIYDAARKLETAGAFAVVLECIPRQLAAQITGVLSIPTIGIGAGPSTDGQILVLYDLLGLYGKIKPRFVRQLADLATAVTKTVETFGSLVRDGSFPSVDESFTMNNNDLPDR